MTRRTCCLSLCLLLAACASSARDVTHDDVEDDGATSTEDGPDDSASDADTDSADTDSLAGTESDSGCAESSFAIEPEPIDMLIVLDRSNSMCDDDLWDPMGQALRNIVQGMSGPVRFGLLLFPSLECQGTLNQCRGPYTTSEVPRAKIGGPNSATWISANLGPGGVGCCGGTPTAETLATAKDYLDTVDDDYRRFVLLATDGAPNCNDALSVPCTCTSADCTDNGSMCLDDTNAVAAAAALYAADYPVYVLGVGGSSAWASVMEDIAVAGGTGQRYAAGSGEFYDTLKQIVDASLPCEFQVDWASLPDGASDDPGMVNLYCQATAGEPLGDANRIGYDEGCADGSGWDWLDSGTIGLCPAACDMLHQGACVAVTASFGCASVPII